MPRTSLRTLVLAAAALALGACADSTITSPAASVAAGPRPSFAVAGGGKTKVDICHRTSDSTYMLITVGAPAYQAHMDHGDLVPGDFVGSYPNQLQVKPDCTLAPVGTPS